MHPRSAKNKSTNETSSHIDYKHNKQNMRAQNYIATHDTFFVMRYKILLADSTISLGQQMEKVLSSIVRSLYDP